MTQANIDIRLLAAGKGVRLWQIAKELGISDTWFTRLMRSELSTEKKNEIRLIIDRLAEGGGSR